MRYVGLPRASIRAPGFQPSHPSHSSSSSSSSSRARDSGKPLPNTIQLEARCWTSHPADPTSGRSPITITITITNTTNLYPYPRKAVAPGEPVPQRALPRPRTLVQTSHAPACGNQNQNQNGRRATWERRVLQPMTPGPLPR
ncbi:hypothetical protein CSUB01_06088 [Colletotrichum sublineola]|uniref:Uncharacterized protein n=1 Tax=Colletotrichum sublineola TaxID=1173701 RepID=A0A066X422_COLSU|nr:hypothetical protein CSUB01_06088 [Colletotrichum sublineola]